MMKYCVPIILSVFLFISCSRKSVPSKSTGSTGVITNSNTQVTNSTTSVAPPTTSASAPAPATTSTSTSSAKAMIVVDGNGRVLTPQEKLPQEANLKPDYTSLARGFTPEQKANLMYRFKTIPPRILYVSDAYTSKSLRGTYCVYKKKFWYWKKQDGLFYLDETYYK